MTSIDGPSQRPVIDFTGPISLTGKQAELGYEIWTKPYLCLWKTQDVTSYKSHLLDNGDTESRRGEIKGVSTRMLEGFAKKGRETWAYCTSSMSGDGFATEFPACYSQKLSPSWGLGR